MIRVNLLATSLGSAPPRDWLPREQRSAAVGLVLLMLTGVGVSGWWWYLNHASATVQTKIATANAELLRLKDVAALVERASARKSELAERLALIERLRATMRGPVRLLETISHSLPEGLWLIEVKQINTATQVEGRASSLTAVTDFAEQLQNSGLFQRPVEIVATSTEIVDDVSVIRFVVKGEAPVPPTTGTVVATASAGAAAAPAAQPKAPGAPSGTGS